MRRPIFFTAIFSLALTGSINARAEDEPAPQRAISPSNASLPASEPLVDRMAAEFFEESLRPSQAKRVEAATADAYRKLSPVERAQFRAERIAQWQAMSDAQRQSLRGVKTPSYLNLDDAQKQTFREIATGKLSAPEPTGAPGTEI